MEPLKSKYSQDHGAYNDPFCLSITLELFPPPGFAGPPCLSSSLDGSWLLVSQQEAGTKTPSRFSGIAIWVKTFIELLSFTSFCFLFERFWSSRESFNDPAFSCLL